jgi:cytoskeletal protein RodZ
MTSIVLKMNKIIFSPATYFWGIIGLFSLLWWYASCQKETTESVTTLRRMVSIKETRKKSFEELS